MELGCDGVLINSAIANAKKPILMAKLLRMQLSLDETLIPGGRMEKNYFAKQSTPSEGII